MWTQQASFFLIHCHVTAVYAHFIFCCVQPKAIWICNEQVLEHQIFMLRLCYWTCECHELQRDTVTEESQLWVRESRAGGIISTMSVWALRPHTIYQQINLSGLSSFIDCSADEEDGVDWMWATEGRMNNWQWHIQRNETLVLLTVHPEREMCRMRRWEIDRSRADRAQSVSVWSMLGATQCCVDNTLSTQTKH